MSILINTINITQNETALIRNQKEILTLTYNPQGANASVKFTLIKTPVSVNNDGYQVLFDDSASKISTSTIHYHEHLTLNLSGTYQIGVEETVNGIQKRKYVYIQANALKDAISTPYPGETTEFNSADGWARKVEDTIQALSQEEGNFSVIGFKTLTDLTAYSLGDLVVIKNIDNTDISGFIYELESLGNTTLTNSSIGVVVDVIEDSGDVYYSGGNYYHVVFHGSFLLNSPIPPFNMTSGLSIVYFDDTNKCLSLTADIYIGKYFYDAIKGINLIIEKDVLKKNQTDEYIKRSDILINIELGDVVDKLPADVDLLIANPSQTGLYTATVLDETVAPTFYPYPQGFILGTNFYNASPTFPVIDGKRSFQIFFAVDGATKYKKIRYATIDSITNIENGWDIWEDMGGGGLGYLFSITDPITNDATKQAIINVYDGVKITLTTTGADQTLGDSTTPNKVFTVINLPVSTYPINILHEIVGGTFITTVLEAGIGIKYFWDGLHWSILEGVDASQITYVPGIAGLVSTNVQDVIEELALRFMPAFTLNSDSITPSTSPIEFGTIIPSLTVDWTYKTDYTVVRLPKSPTFVCRVSDTTPAFYDISIPIGVPTPPYSSITSQIDSALNIAYEETSSAIKAVSRTYTLMGTGDDNLPFTYSNSISWGFYTYWGVNAASDLVNTGDVTGLALKSIRLTDSQQLTNYTFSISSGSQYLYIAIPAAFADLVRFWFAGIETTFLKRADIVAVPTIGSSFSYSDYKIFRSLLPQTSSPIVVTVTS